MKKPFKVPPLEPLTDKDENTFDPTLREPGSLPLARPPTKRPKESRAHRLEYFRDNIGKVKGHA